MLLLLRYFWFIAAAMMLANVAIWRGRMGALVEAGTVTAGEAAALIRGATLWLTTPAIALGVIGLLAGWSDPMCAGVLSFSDTWRAAASLVTLAAWGALLGWVWIGSGAELLGRVAAGLSNAPEPGRGYSPALVRAAVTGVLLVAGAGGALMWRTIPGIPADGCMVTFVRAGV